MSAQTRPTTVYLVLSHIDYEGGRVHGVFSTRYRAEIALELAKKKRAGDDCEIVTVPQDEFQENIYV